MQAKVRALRIACEIFGPTPWHAAVQRRQAADVQPLEVTKQRVKAKKDVVNK